MPAGLVHVNVTSIALAALEGYEPPLSASSPDSAFLHGPGALADHARDLVDGQVAEDPGIQDAPSR